MNRRESYEPIEANGNQGGVFGSGFISMIIPTVIGLAIFGALAFGLPAILSNKAVPHGIVNFTTAAPTTAPSAAPSAVPTTAPTKAPTTAPTAAPTI